MRKLSAVSGLIAGFAMLLGPAVSSAGISFSIRIAPPVLEIYEQPLCPTDGYIWTPGYWGYGDGGYYWIPGAWVRPPQEGFLYTPGYWGYVDGLYVFNAGYWGPTVGFYGGVNYGFGYGGNGYEGGRWQGGHFAYNTAVSRVNTTVIHNTYNQGVASHTGANQGSNRTSFNGGPGGISARPNAAEATNARAHNQPAAAPASQQRASVSGPVAHQQARPETAPAASRAQERPAVQERQAARPQQAQAARPQQQPREVASNRSAQQAHAAAPQQRSAPEQRATPAQRSAPEQHAAPAQHSAPAGGGKEERK